MLSNLLCSCQVTMAVLLLSDHTSYNYGSSFSLGMRIPRKSRDYSCQWHKYYLCELTELTVIFLTCVQHSWLMCMPLPALLASTLSPLTRFLETTLRLPRLILAGFDLMFPHWRENKILLGLFVCFCLGKFLLIGWFRLVLNLIFF